MPVEESTGGKYEDVPIWIQSKKVFIASEDEVSLTGYRAFEDAIVIRVTADVDGLFGSDHLRKSSDLLQLPAYDGRITLELAEEFALNLPKNMSRDQHMNATATGQR